MSTFSPSSPLPGASLAAEPVLPDSIGYQLRRWAEGAPDWEAAIVCRQMIEQFSRRTASLETRLGMPLIVVTLGGTGTGKSTLVNALLGARVVREGKERPTTDRPVFVCHTRIDPAAWGIDTSGFLVEKHDLPVLERLVLIDAPDPDTTEDSTLRESNLSRLRHVLPLCDMLLITGTQQKYRSRRVADELIEAAPGARLLFVQTHAGRDVDIRADWKNVLQERYEPGEIFLVDSLDALNTRLAGGEPGGDFAKLHRLLTCELNEEAALHVRQANYVDLVAQALELCGKEIEAEWPMVDRLREEILKERRRLGEELAGKIRKELIADRRLWESRLIGRVASQWGFSPFSLVLRVYQGLGGIISGALLARARSVPQMALWGVFEAGRSLKKWRNGRRSQGSPGRSLINYWEEGNIRNAATVLAGFAKDARLPTGLCSTQRALDESNAAGKAFVSEIALELEKISDRLAGRYDTLKIRLVYEGLFGAMLLFLLWRPAKNFFWDTLWNSQVPLYGLDYYLVSLFWLLVLGSGLLAAFSLMLRWGLQREIDETAVRWCRIHGLETLFHALETETKRIFDFRTEREAIQNRLEQMNRLAEKLDKRLGKLRRISPY